MVLRRFYPPIEHPTVGWLARRSAARLVRGWMRIDSVALGDADRSRLPPALRGPVVLCPNHPSYHDVFVLLHALDRLGVPALTIAAWELLAFVPAWLRLVYRGIGCYSVRRGTPDAVARQFTIDAVVGGRVLVFFPEGNVNGLNDCVEPYYPQLPRMAFDGQQQRLAQRLGSSVLMAPVAIKYVYQDDMTAPIAASMAGLEARLGLPGPAPRRRLERLQRLFGACLEWVQRAIAGAAPAGLSLADRLEQVLDHLEHSIAERLGRTLPEARARGLRLAGLYQDYMEHATLPGARHFPNPLPTALWPGLKRDMELLHHLHGMRDGYVAAYPSAERYADVLGRLERVMTGEQQLVGRRRVIVKIGRPVDLADHLAAYRVDRRATYAHVTGLLRQRTAALQDRLTRAVPAIDEPGGAG